MTGLGPGVVVAVAAAVVTAHGLIEVVIAARVPAQLAWLYPLITDGLAAVAYRATGRLASGARRYAWCVVVLAAAVSGLAQAAFLASGHLDASAALRFGIGAWPAVAAALVAHLLHLLTGAALPDPPADVQSAITARGSDRACASAVGRVEVAEDHVPTPAERATTATSSRNAGPSYGDPPDADHGDAVLSDGEKRAAAVQDWTSFLQEHPEASSPEKKEYGARVATRYKCSMRWSYYRRADAERALGPASEAGHPPDHTGSARDVQTHGDVAAVRGR